MNTFDQAAHGLEELTREEMLNIEGGDSPIYEIGKKIGTAIKEVLSFNGGGSGSINY